MTYPTVGSEREGDEVVHTIDRRDLVCPACGYAIVAAQKPPRCPMCGSEQWDFAVWKPFTGSAGPPRRALP